MYQPIPYDTHHWYCQLATTSAESTIQNKRYSQNYYYFLQDLPHNFESKYSEYAMKRSQQALLVKLEKVVVDSPNAKIKIILSTSKIKFIELPFHQKYSPTKAMTGERTILMVRVSANGPNPLSISESEIHKAVIGESMNSMNSQYKACSYNKLSFKTPSSPGVPSNGIISIKLNSVIYGKDVRTAINDAIFEIENGPVGSIDHFDHVVFFVQFGTFFDSNNLFWNAYGVQNGKMSVYNNKLGGSLSSLMHEVGHNLGLQHSTENGVEYGDHTGYMGESFVEASGPFMCFNAAKSWQLGWYQDRNIEISLGGSKESLVWQGKLYGVDDYENIDDISALVAKIEISNDEDYYMMYNSKKGINVGTMNFGDKVVIVSSNGIGKSSLQAPLGAYENYRISNFQNTTNNLVIEICKITPIYATAMVFIESNPPPEVWHDERGTSYNCTWYELENACETDGYNYRNFGRVAREACCFCNENDELHLLHPTNLPSFTPSGVPSIRPSNLPSLEPSTLSHVNDVVLETISSHPSYRPSFRPSNRPSTTPTQTNYRFQVLNLFRRLFSFLSGRSIFAGVFQNE